jgi:hypothetical protein
MKWWYLRLIKCENALFWLSPFYDTLVLKEMLVTTLVIYQTGKGKNSGNASILKSQG